MTTRPMMKPKPRVGHCFTRKHNLLILFCEPYDFLKTRALNVMPVSF